MKWKNRESKVDLVSFFLLDEKILNLPTKIKLFYFFNEDIDEILKFEFYQWNKVIKIKENLLKQKEELIKENWENLKEKAKDLILNKDLNDKIKVLTIYDEDYPLRIIGKDLNNFNKNFLQPSPVIFYLGNIKLLSMEQDKYISIVGSRNATKLSIEITSSISKYYSQNGDIIVSGFAKGVDYISHQIALNNGGKTIGILGNGVDIIYPAQNLTLYKEFLKSDSLLISEFPPGTPPFKQNFYIRNRLIAFIANKVYFIQGGIPSGGLITAKYALDYRKKVYVFYCENEKYYKGNIELSKNGKVFPFNLFYEGEHLFLKNETTFNKNLYFESKENYKNENLKKIILTFIVNNPYTDFDGLKKSLLSNSVNFEINKLLENLSILLQERKISISYGIFYYPLLSNISKNDIFI